MKKLICLKSYIFTPTRYNLVDDLENIHDGDLSSVNNIDYNSDKLTEGVKKPSASSEKFYLSDKVGYSLNITGAAAGSRFYSLYGTLDGGSTWKYVKEV